MENEHGHHYTTGLTYRRRDVSDGNGGNDNGVWVDFSFPTFRTPKKPERDIAELQRRVVELEHQLSQLTPVKEPPVDQSEKKN